MQIQGGAAGAFELTIPSRFNRANIDAGIGRRAYRGDPIFSTSRNNTYGRPHGAQRDGDKQAVE
jgi:hypothetical protein